MSVQRWKLTDRYGEPAIAIENDDGGWVTFDTHAAEVARLTAALLAARDALKDWGSYAGEYFQQKHGLANDIAAIDAALAPAARKETTDAEA